MKIPPIVLKILYHLIHSIYTLYEFVIDLVIIVKYQFYIKSIPQLDHQDEVIDRLRRGLRKIPSSITFVVSKEELEDFEYTVNKLGKLIKWSTALNIQHISVFDETGLLVNRRQEVLKRVEKCTMPGTYPASKVNIKIKNGCTEPYYALQMPDRDDCWLRFLSDCDGRQHMIKIARKMCHRYSNKSPSNDNNFNESNGQETLDIDKKLVNLDMMCDAIKAEYNFPDPELIVRTSSTASIFGFCPWQMRLTEIVFLPHHSSLIYVSKVIPTIESRVLFQDFVDSLAKFSLCQQRVGK